MLYGLQKINGEVKLGFNGDLYQESGADVVMTTTGDLVRYDSERERLGIGVLLWLLRPLFGVAKNITGVSKSAVTRVNGMK